MFSFFLLIESPYKKQFLIYLTFIGVFATTLAKARAIVFIYSSQYTIKFSLFNN